MPSDKAVTRDSAFNALANVIMLITGLDYGISVDYLGVLLYGCLLIAGFFSIFTLAHWAWASGGPLPSVLTVEVGFKYLLSMFSAGLELNIARTLFPQDRERTPDEFRTSDRLKLSLVVLFYVFTYAFIVYYVGNIAYVSAVLMILACLDLNTRRMINNKMNEYLNNSRYSPLSTERSYDEIMHKRKIASHYLFDNYHKAKEVLCALGYTGALVVAAATGLYTLGYIIVIAVLLLNEIVQLRWRYPMIKELREATTALTNDEGTSVK